MRNSSLLQPIARFQGVVASIPHDSLLVIRVWAAGSVTENQLARFTT